VACSSPLCVITNRPPPSTASGVPATTLLCAPGPEPSVEARQRRRCVAPALCGLCSAAGGGRCRVGGDSEPPAQRLLGDRAFWCGSGLYPASWRLLVEILTTSGYLTYVLLLLRIQAFLLSPHLTEERPLRPCLPWRCSA